MFFQINDDDKNGKGERWDVRARGSRSGDKKKKNDYAIRAGIFFFYFILFTNNQNQ